MSPSTCECHHRSRNHVSTWHKLLVEWGLLGLKLQQSTSEAHIYGKFAQSHLITHAFAAQINAAAGADTMPCQ